MGLCFLLVLSLIATTLGYHRYPDRVPCTLEEVAGWSRLRFSNPGTRRYVPDNCIFTGVTAWRDQLIVAVPRFSEGVPATLTWLPRHPPSHSPPLQPFPSWDWQDGHVDGCRGLVSVFRTRVDRCGRLWAIDSGRFPASRQLCPPRLVIFDPESGHHLRSITVPPHVLRPTSLLTFIEFDPQSENGCDDMLVYIVDIRGFGLIVYDLKKDKFWRFEHESFNLKPENATYTIEGESATTVDGIVAVAISYLGSERTLFYQPFSSYGIYAVPTAALRRPGTQLAPVRLLEKSSQGVGLAAEGGRLIFNPLADTSLVTWRPGDAHPRVIVKDRARLQFLSDINTDVQGELWAVSNRFQSFANKTYSDGINLRILRMTLGNCPT